MSLREEISKKIENGRIKLKEKLRPPEKKTILSEEEKKKINNFPMTRILNNVVEYLNEDELALLSTVMLNTDSREKIFEKIRKEGYLYTVSVKAGCNYCVKFENLLKKEEIPERHIRRIGSIGFWHYFLYEKYAVQESFTVFIAENCDTKISYDRFSIKSQ